MKTFQSAPRRIRQTRFHVTAERGFSLIELMVALVLGLVIVGGVLNIFVTNQQAFRTNEGLGRIQENIRFSFEQMAREIRQAGGNPCGASGPPRVINTVTWETNWEAAGPIQGFDGDEDATGIVDNGTDPAERVDDTDAIKLLGGNLGQAHLFTNTASNPIDFALNARDGLSDGLLMACDSDTTVIGPGVITPSGSTFVAKLAANTTQLASGGFVSPYTASLWYIGNNSRGGRSLYRTGLGMGGLGPQEIAEGVMDMQIDYLLRPKPTDPDNPPGPPDDAWLGASALTWINSTGGTGIAWLDDPAEANNPTKEVVAARLTLTLETLGAVGTDAKPLTRQLIHVVNIRNKGMQ